MLGLLTQVKIFFLTLLLGVIAGFIIHFYQLGIKALKVGKYTLFLLDFIFWMFMIVVVALGMLVINQGELRFYTLIFLILGGIIYFKTLAARLYKPLKTMAEAGAHFIDMLVSQLLKPVVWLVNKIRTKWRNHHPPAPPDDFNL
ncbi:MAG: hypothetical protein GXY49_04330 [Syntrophomonadaceae bacterium]|nr:hypothetical protein [Syntrophomonadaceae bacterium]